MPGAGEKDEKNKPDSGNPDDENTGNQPGADDGDEGDDEGDLGDFADPKKAFAEIKRLRQENAKHRTKNRDLESKFNGLNDKMGKLQKALGGEEDQEDPEEKVAKLQSHTDELEARLAIKNLAIEHDIPKDQHEYFEFLLGKEFANLEDGESLEDEQIAAVAQKVKATGGGKSEKSGTGLNDGQGKKKPDGKSGPTPEEFAKMSTSEKTALYVKNPDLYNRLFAEAKEKNLLFR